ncbi:ABC transporter permease subunit [Singulisphaera sp. PoT]|uniref:ABC transporter permease subunit n=1 Tax=Singulisphaera sp. PoT TaxID=3411797 RepID=UPI003BF4AF7B
MVLGPVFSVELLTAARRRRNYVIRFVYGLILLYFIWQTGPSNFTYYNRTAADEYSHQELARIGGVLFSTFLAVQSVTILLMTPALVAGVIADEKQRKTLHYLLASSLSSFEIIVGKLASKLLQLGVLILIGIPVLSLISLFGGVEPIHIAASLVASLTTVFFLATLSILISVHARRPREAISLAYLLAGFWLFAPGLIQWIMPAAGGFWSRVYEWIKPVNEWVASSSPFYVLSGGLGRSIFGSTAGFLTEVGWMCGLQFAYGLLFLTLAVLRLRPVYRNQGEGARSRLKFLTRRGRLFGRPPCGDDAMIWKERYVSRTSVLTKILSGLVALASLGTLLYFTFDYFAIPAFREFYWAGSGATSARSEFNGYLRGVCTTIYVLWCIALASAASGSLTSEREEDTWISLVATPLSGLEIIRAKMFGAIWSVRWAGVLMLFLWLLGVICGAIHPLGLIIIVVETVAFLGFVDALATYFSLRSAKSSRALVATIALLIFLNGGYMLLCIPLRADTILVAVGVTPLIEAYSLLSYEDVSQYFGGMNPGFRTMDRAGEAVLVCFLSTILYSAAAIALTFRAIERFDSVVDRPRRAPIYYPSPAPPGPAKSKPDDELAT